MNKHRLEKSPKLWKLETLQDKSLKLFIGSCFEQQNDYTKELRKQHKWVGIWKDHLFPKMEKVG